MTNIVTMDLDKIKSIVKASQNIKLISIKEDKVIRQVYDVIEKHKVDYNYVEDELHDLLTDLECQSQTDYEYDIDYHFEKNRRSDIQHFFKAAIAKSRAEEREKAKAEIVSWLTNQWKDEGFPAQYRLAMKKATEYVKAIESKGE